MSAVKSSAPLKSRPRCGTSHGVRQWINLEPCGLFCGHFAAMTTDPGAVPRDSVPLPDDADENDFEAAAKGKGERFRKFCKRCRAFKPLRAHHCSVCGRCIVKMDHHCPWVNNCVGIGNHKLFLLFLLWVNLVCAYALVLSICKYTFCDGEGCGDSTQNLLGVFLVVEASLFGLFTVCMMGDQSSVLTTNQTKIDVLKGVRSEGVESFNEVFGCSSDVAFRADWLVPRRAVFPESIRDRVMGYSLDAQAGLLHEGEAEMTSCAATTNPMTTSSSSGSGGGGGSGGGSGSVPTQYDGEDNDLSRTRLGSTEIWGLSEGMVSPATEGKLANGNGWPPGYAVRRRSGPPF